MVIGGCPVSQYSALGIRDGMLLAFGVIRLMDRIRNLNTLRREVHLNKTGYGILLDHRHESVQQASTAKHRRKAEVME